MNFFSALLVEIEDGENMYGNIIYNVIIIINFGTQSIIQSKMRNLHVRRHKKTTIPSIEFLVNFEIVTV
jgi:hypothetical protein